ncbi:MAG: cellulose biosynthesis protein BcsS, partial [Hyphomicrobium sp.]
MLVRRSLGLSAALLLGLSGSFATAADMVLKAPAVAPEPVEYGNLYFGTDINSNGGLVGYAGILYAPGGMDKSGLRLSVFGLKGKYEYKSQDAFDQDTTFNGRFTSIDALIGYSTVFNNGAATLAIGANFQNQKVTPFDIDNPVQGDQ